ncbi:hypothetical protein P171DRAFT_448244 [Karstenula rhodostoma CBS 690.94]|uniref:Uncharacterized protein n=1 Tax=Karstenula rhodostoma CBS 690.94 TaxID=1392251 RepID=A0A9P4P8T9_9PLEO|nr:hypothetical protein P171DRAFT_448244 [Karstenula rhodostoma CBS 690.94]
MFEDIVYVNAMQTILERSQVRLNPLEAGKIVGCFVRLSSEVYLTFDSYPDNPGWRTVHETLSQFWVNLIADSDLNDDNRDYMNNINLRHTIRRLWKSIRYYRRRGRSGHELWIEVASRLTQLALVVLNITRDNQAQNSLLFGMCLQFPNGRSRGAWLFLPEEGTNETADRANARMTPVSAVSEPCSRDEDCNICCEKLVDGVEVKSSNNSQAQCYRHTEIDRTLIYSTCDFVFHL